MVVTALLCYKTCKIAPFSVDFLCKFFLKTSDFWGILKKPRTGQDAGKGNNNKYEKFQLESCHLMFFQCEQ